MIDFAENDGQAYWKGYIYAGGFFVVVVLQSGFFNMMLYQSMSIGMRIRAALIDAIFKKVCFYLIVYN